jgi:hypothetical protein
MWMKIIKPAKAYIKLSALISFRKVASQTNTDFTYLGS